MILKLYNSKKTIENSHLRTKLLSSGYQEIVDKLIDKTIFVHAPFLKNLSNDFDKIVKGWSEYWEIYNKKAIFRELRKKADELLDDLNEENYSEDNFLITISMNLSFKISTGENITTDSIESFPYLIALVDEKDNIIVKKKLDYSFKNISVMDTFILEEDKINIRIPNIAIDEKNARLLIGFINR